jgi:hypothetical protein
MERRSNHPKDAMLASLIRQFAPSRLEHQLLAQVFESVVAVRRRGQPATLDSAGDPQPNEEQRVVAGNISRFARRSAA